MKSSWKANLKGTNRLQLSIHQYSKAPSNHGSFTQYTHVLLLQWLTSLFILLFVSVSQVQLLGIQFILNQLFLKNVACEIELNKTFGIFNGSLCELVIIAKSYYLETPLQQSVVGSKLNWFLMNSLQLQVKRQQVHASSSGGGGKNKPPSAAVTLKPLSS